MTTLNRRNISAIAKLDFSGLSHAQRIDAIAKALGHKSGEALMGALKAAEAQPQPAHPKATSSNPIISVQLFGQFPCTEFDEGSRFSGDGDVSTVSFETRAEFEAYHKGLADADGWMETTQAISTIDDPDHPYFAALKRHPDLSFQDWWNDSFVFVHAAGEPGDPEDADVPGIYVLSYDPRDVTSEGDLAGSALDAFHSRRAVECLDDFTFTVFTAQGDLITEAEDYVDYSGAVEMSLEGRSNPDAIAPEILKAMKTALG